MASFPVSYVSMPRELSVYQSEKTGRKGVRGEDPTPYVHQYKETYGKFYERLGDFRDSKQCIWIRTMNVTFAGPVFPVRLNYLGCRDWKRVLGACTWNWPVISNFLLATLQSCLGAFHHYSPFGVFHDTFHPSQRVNSISKSQPLSSHSLNHLKVNGNRTKAMAKVSV